MTHSSFTHFAPFFYSSTAEQRRPESIFKTQTPLLFQNFWIRVRQVFKFKNPTPVQTQATIIDQTAIYPWFYLRIDRTDSCYCRNGKVTPIPDPVFHKFLTPGPDLAPKEKSRIQPESTPVIRIRSHFCSRGGRSHFFRLWLRSCFKNF